VLGLDWGECMIGGNAICCRFRMLVVMIDGIRAGCHRKPGVRGPVLTAKRSRSVVVMSMSSTVRAYRTALIVYTLAPPPLCKRRSKNLRHKPASTQCSHKWFAMPLDVL